MVLRTGGSGTDVHPKKEHASIEEADENSDKAQEQEVNSVKEESETEKTEKPM